MLLLFPLISNVFNSVSSFLLRPLLLLQLNTLLLLLYCAVLYQLVVISVPLTNKWTECSFFGASTPRNSLEIENEMTGWVLRSGWRQQLISTVLPKIVEDDIFN